MVTWELEEENFWSISLSVSMRTSCRGTRKNYGCGGSLAFTVKKKNKKKHISAIVLAILFLLLCKFFNCFSWEPFRAPYKRNIREKSPAKSLLQSPPKSLGTRNCRARPWKSLLRFLKIQKSQKWLWKSLRPSKGNKTAGIEKTATSRFEI